MFSAIPLSVLRAAAKDRTISSGRVYASLKTFKTAKDKHRKATQPLNEKKDISL